MAAALADFHEYVRRSADSWGAKLILVNLLCWCCQWVGEPDRSGNTHWPNRAIIPERDEPVAVQLSMPNIPFRARTITPRRPE